MSINPRVMVDASPGGNAQLLVWDRNATNAISFIDDDVIDDVPELETHY